jgi:hypothetical protein
MTPALVHQTGLKTERKWKNYYRSARKPEEEEKILQHGNSAPLKMVNIALFTESVIIFLFVH